MTSIRAIDLFSGIGGNSWGARAAGVEIVAGFDKWELAGQVYQDNFPEAKFFPVDLASLSRQRIREIKDEIGDIDLILASPECTSHSVARGARAREKASLRLSWNVWRFAEVFQPRWLVIENVVAMTKWDYYQDFLQILRGTHPRRRASISLRYHCREQFLTASDFNVPQKRRRLYIVCDREQEPPEIHPLCASPPPALQAVDLNGHYRYSPLVTPKRAKSTLARAERAFQVLGKESPFLLVYYGSDGSGGWQRLDAPLRTITTLDRFALVKPDGNGGHMMRMLQPPELQTAMGFPPEFRLEHGNRRQKIHLLGNAVCPPVMTAIIRALTSAGEQESGKRTR